MMWKFFISTGNEKKILVPPMIVTYGVAFPASPVDGQEHILVDSITLPTWEMRFRYNAGSTATIKWEPVVKHGYGTAFPASPFDGQEFVLVDSITAPTYKWRFRYNASATSIYKWEYIGGSPAYRSDGTGRQNSVDSTWQYISGMPHMVLPRAGQYRYRHGIDWSGNNANITYVTIGTISAGNLISPNYIQLNVGNSFGANLTLPVSTIQSDEFGGNVRAAGDDVGLVMQSTAHTNISIVTSYLEIEPVRVS